MVILALASVLSIIALLRALQGKPLATFKGWLELAVPILALIGLGVALYLTYVETTQAMAICGPVGDCNTVQSSSYSKLFGFLPVGLLGALALSFVLQGLLYEMSARDPATFVIAIAILTLTVAVACFFPSLRATRVEPVVALRYE